MDPQQQDQITHMAMALIPVAIGIGLLFMAFIIFLFWRIFVKAGMSGWLSLIILFYPIGFFIVLCILAFADWKVLPVAPAVYYPPSYPPPPPPPPAFQAPPQV